MNVLSEPDEVDLERLAAVAGPRPDLAAESVYLVRPWRFVLLHARWTNEEHIDIGLVTALAAGRGPE